MNDDDEHGLEEQVDGIAIGYPEIDPEDGGDHKDGTDVDGEGAYGFLLAD